MRRIVGEAHDEAVQLLADNRERLDSFRGALPGGDARRAGGVRCGRAGARRRDTAARARDPPVGRRCPALGRTPPATLSGRQRRADRGEPHGLVLYELPNLNSAIHQASFYPCSVDNACRAPKPWGISWFTSMFMHGSWDHILGNMLFLAIFGKNVEDAFGHVRYLAFYVAGGFAAAMTQPASPMLFGSAAATRVPNLGASGAIAAVLGAFFLLYPTARIRTLLGIFFVPVPAWVYLGGGFLYQLVEGDSGLTSASANGGGVAFFAHIGGFVFGALVTAGSSTQGASSRRARCLGPPSHLLRRSEMSWEALTQMFAEPQTETRFDAPRSYSSSPPATVSRRQRRCGHGRTGSPASPSDRRPTPFALDGESILRRAALLESEVPLP